jgi:hypothetical protein
MRCQGLAKPIEGFALRAERGRKLLYQFKQASMSAKIAGPISQFAFSSA